MQRVLTLLFVVMLAGAGVRADKEVIVRNKSTVSTIKMIAGWTGETDVAFGGLGEVPARDDQLNLKQFFNITIPPRGEEKITISDDVETLSAYGYEFVQDTADWRLVRFNAKEVKFLKKEGLLSLFGVGTLVWETSSFDVIPFDDRYIKMSKGIQSLTIVKKLSWLNNPTSQLRFFNRVPYSFNLVVFGRGAISYIFERIDPDDDTAVFTPETEIIHVAIASTVGQLGNTASTFPVVERGISADITIPPGANVCAVFNLASAGGHFQYFNAFDIGVERDRTFNVQASEKLFLGINKEAPNAARDAMRPVLQQAIDVLNEA